MRKIWRILAVVLPVLIGLYMISIFLGPTLDREKTWQLVTTFSGSSGQTMRTNPFDIVGAMRLRWVVVEEECDLPPNVEILACEPEAEVLEIHIFRAGPFQEIAKNIHIGPSIKLAPMMGEITIQGSSSYYLFVYSSIRAVSWTITIEEVP